MTTSQLAAVCYLARPATPTTLTPLYVDQLRRWFVWCEASGLDRPVGIERGAHVELFIRGLSESGLMDSSITTMMNGVRGVFRFAHIDGIIPSDPAV